MKMKTEKNQWNKKLLLREKKSIKLIILQQNWHKKEATKITSIENETEAPTIDPVAVRIVRGSMSNDTLMNGVGGGPFVPGNTIQQWKRMSLDTLKRIVFNKNKPISKRLHIVRFHLDSILEMMKLWKTGNRSVHAKGSGREKGEDGCGFKGLHEGPSDETIIYDCGWSHNSTGDKITQNFEHTGTHAHTPLHACWWNLKPQEGWQIVSVFISWLCYCSIVLHGVVKGIWISLYDFLQFLTIISK